MQKQYSKVSLLIISDSWKELSNLIKDFFLR